MGSEIGGDLASAEVSIAAQNNKINCGPPPDIPSLLSLHVWVYQVCPEASPTL